jgi:UDP-2,3-diacylglucosamine hydrolase
MNPPDSLGIIAGNRSLPFLIASEARKHGVRKIIAAAFEGETDPKLATIVEEIVWLRVGQLSKMIDAFKDRGINQCVMAGQIAPKNLFDLRPDLRAMMLLFKLKERNAHSIFGGIAHELEKEGIRLIEATPWLKPAMPGAGFHCGPKLSKQARQDAEYGYGIAREISRLEIGQTVVVKEGSVLAVEGFEGTDRCLQRGAELAGKKGGAIAVKVAKHNHDMRFDIPCIGLQTVQTCRDSGLEVIAVERDKTILLEKEAVEQFVAKNGPTIVTVPFTQ